jgi:hypothetical protein
MFDGFDSSSRKYVVRLVGIITNRSGKTVTKLSFSVARPKAHYRYYVESGVLHIEPGQSIEGDIGVIGNKDEIRSPLNLQVTAVRFADGSTWGTIESDLLTSPLRTDPMLSAEGDLGQAVDGSSVAGSSGTLQRGMPPVAGINGRHRLQLNRQRHRV